MTGAGAREAGGYDSEMVQAFSRDLAARITRLSEWQLNYWDRLGIVRPSIVVEAEPGLPRLYDFRDVLKLRVAAEFRKRHWRPTQIRNAMLRLEARGIDDPLFTVTFIAEPKGGEILMVDPSSDTAMSARNPDQKALPFVDLDMKDLRSGLVARISELTRRKTGEIKKLRSVMGSQPVIVGTRVPTEKIALLASQGLTAPAIAAALPSLTVEDVEAALEFERAQQRRRRSA